MRPTTLTPTTTVGTASDEARGMLLGLIGVAIFSLTLPFTRLAVRELDPLFLTLARALGAAVLAAGWLRMRRVAWPGRAALRPLVIVGLGRGGDSPIFSRAHDCLRRYLRRRRFPSRLSFCGRIYSRAAGKGWRIAIWRSCLRPSAPRANSPSTCINPGSRA